MTNPAPSNDFDHLAYDLIVMITENRNVSQALRAKVSARLQRGPQVTIWPHDIAEASQRARDAARARELPRLAPPVLPTLPRVLAPLTLPTLPRPLSTPVLPTLPRPPLPQVTK